MVSLRREDATRLGYDSAGQWMALLRSKRAMLCKYMKIDSADLRWYAAFHNEGHHPHVHLMVYSAKDNDGYLTKAGIESMRSELAHDIFRQDFAQIYEGQTQARAELKAKASERMCLLTDRMMEGVCESPIIGEKLQLLSGRLKNISGKKVYGYLKADMKKLVDQIVDELAKEPKVAEAYQAWGEWRNQILLTYSSKAPPLPPLSKQKELKSIRNMVIAEALKLGGHHFLQEVSDQESDFPEPDLDDGEEKSDSNEPEEEDAPLDPGREEEPLSEEESVGDEGWENTRKAEWNRKYKRARSYLYESENRPQDFSRAMELFLEEADAGNALAMYDLGRMWADGLGVEADLEKAQKWYQRALDTFRYVEKNLPERKKSYLQYRIGKMYLAGLGTPKDFGTAADWLGRAAEKRHKYAQYTLAGLFAAGKGVKKNPERAAELYRASAAQGNPYAGYELGKMCLALAGTGIKKSEEQAEIYFQDAFSGFLSLEKQSHDDKLQYRLGQMLYQGTGTEKDEEEAVRYWQQAAKLGNANARYALGKHWLDTGTGDVQQAVKWLEKSADAGNVSAQYVLAKCYLEGDQVEVDIQKATTLFEKAASQGNGYAAYRLGKLYLEGEVLPKDVEAAVRWLSEAAAQELPFAEYMLGCLYLEGEEVPKDMERAVEWLELSSVQGNQYAQYILGKLYLCGQPGLSQDREKAISLLKTSAAQGNVYARFLLDHADSFRDPDLVLAATRLMHHLSRIFQEDYRKASGGTGMGTIDRKRRRKLQEKRMAQGHKKDDHAPQQRM